MGMSWGKQMSEKWSWDTHHLAGTNVLISTGDNYKPLGNIQPTIEFIGKIWCNMAFFVQGDRKSPNSSWSFSWFIPRIPETFHDHVWELNPIILVKAYRSCSMFNPSVSDSNLSFLEIQWTLFISGPKDIPWGITRPPCHHSGCWRWVKTKGWANIFRVPL